jgi:hypothetical protein
MKNFDVTVYWVLLLPTYLIWETKITHFTFVNINLQLENEIKSCIQNYSRTSKFIFDKENLPLWLCFIKLSKKYIHMQEKQQRELKSNYLNTSNRRAKKENMCFLLLKFKKKRRIFKWVKIQALNTWKSFYFTNKRLARKNIVLHSGVWFEVFNNTKIVAIYMHKDYCVLLVD